MGSTKVDHKKKDDQQRVSRHGEAVSTEADTFLLIEELFGLKYIMRALFIIALPVLTFFTLYNLLRSQLIEAVLVCFMGILILFSRFALGQSKIKSWALEKQYGIYQNVLRSFLLIFLIYLSYVVGWKNELALIQWSYVFPIIAFLSLRKREGFYWAAFFLVSMVIILFYPRSEGLSSDTVLGFKLRYIMSFAVLCAVGIAWRRGIEVIHARLVHRQDQLAESEKRYREAYEGLQREMEQRQQVQNALAESEERYRLIFENSVDVIYSMDREFRATDVSPSIEKTLGYSPGEMIGRPMQELGILTPESLERAFSDILRVLAGTPVLLAFYTFIAKDGTPHYAEVSGAPLKRKGEVVGLISIARDVTGRKLAEEEKHRLEERLRHADKMESIGTLAGGIAHNFNNLLMVIQGYASMALSDIDPSHPNYKRLKNIEEQVASGIDLTKQLLGFARGGRYEVKPTDMNDIIERTSSMFSQAKKEISINLKYGKDLFTVEVDQGQMAQVFMNLYVNASQAMPRGGDICLGTENIILDDEQASHHNVKPGKYVKITVTDTGTGMDEKTQERIFDPFFTTKAMERGTGLGLATVYGIIDGHKGVINVYSEPGHGTTFTIYLPASEKAVLKEKAMAGTVARGTETILMVDDEKMVLEVCRELLESIGYRVYTAGSGQEAIAVYMEKRNDIDLVILDMIMPGISGGTTFDRLQEINPGIKVLLSSGYSIDGEAQAIMDRGCNGFLQKPFHLEKLSWKLREMLD